MKKVGLIILAAVFLLGMYVPVSAADLDVYGSAKITTFWTDLDESDTTSLNHTLQGTARFGAIMENDTISGQFEYGASGGTANVRLLYGTVAMPFGDLLIGQTYTPMGAKCFISCQTYNSDENMLQFVGYTGRHPMIQLSSQGFKVALVRPVDPGAETELVADTGTGAITRNEADTGTGVVEEETILAGPEILLPQLQVSYDMDVNPDLFMNFAAAVQSYDLDGGDGDTLTSWQVAYNSTFTIADPFYVNWGGFYGQNVDSLGQYNYGKTDSGYKGTVNDIEDNDTYGVLLVLGTQVNTVGLQGGVGYRASDWDAGDDDMMGYYVNATIPLTADGAAYIRPEVGFYDYGESLNDEDEYYAGLKWEVNF